MAAQGCDPELAQVIFEFLPVVLSAHIVEKMGVTRRPTYRRRFTNDAQRQGSEVKGSVSALSPVDPLSPDCRRLLVKRMTI